MKCINCGLEYESIHRGYCQPCIKSGRIPVHSGFVWHNIIKKKDKIIAELRRIIEKFNTAEE